MKDVRFYLEFPTTTAKHKSGRGNTGHSGNVLAATCDEKGRYLRLGYPTGLDMDCFGAVYDYANSPVGSTSVSFDFIRTRCKRAKESTAREIHPELFKHID